MRKQSQAKAIKCYIKFSYKQLCMLFNNRELLKRNKDKNMIECVVYDVKRHMKCTIIQEKASFYLRHGKYIKSKGIFYRGIFFVFGFLLILLCLEFGSVEEITQTFMKNSTLDNYHLIKKTGAILIQEDKKKEAN